MSDIKLTITQVAAHIGESVHVIRNWLSAFRPHIPVVKSKSGYNLFNQDAIDVLLRIKSMARDQKLTTRQIDAILSGAERPTIKLELDEPNMLDDLAEIKKSLEEQKILYEQLISYLKYRDDQIMHMLQNMQEIKKNQMPEKKKWLGLFRPK